MAETNPHRILKRLDQNLAHPVELTLFGRAALALGFGQALAEWGQTLDIDVTANELSGKSLDRATFRGEGATRGQGAVSAGPSALDPGARETQG